VSDQEVDEGLRPSERAVDGRSISVVECRQQQFVVCANPYLDEPTVPGLPVDDCDAGASRLRRQVHADGPHELTVAGGLGVCRMCCALVPAM
jgi:hypothetical protein